MSLVGNQREYLVLNLSHYILLFLNSIKLSEYRIGIKFDKYPLAVAENNYLTKIVNVYIIYDLDAWPRNPTNNFKSKNYLFRATNILKIVIKKSMYKKDTEQWKLCITINFTFSKANTKFCLSLHYNAGNIYLFVIGKEIFKGKANNKNVNFPTQFCLGSISNGFSNTREVSLNGNVYDFSVDYNFID